MSPPLDLDPRILFAAERTLLAWVRTGVAMMGFGFVVARFGLFLREIALAGGRATMQRSLGSPIVGTALIVLGSIAIGIATIDHARVVRAYSRGEPIVARIISPATCLATLLVVAGIGLAVYLATI